jgi:hypothetical protein
MKNKKANKLDIQSLADWMLELQKFSQVVAQRVIELRRATTDLETRLKKIEGMFKNETKH